MFYKVVQNKLFEFWWMEDKLEQKFFLQIYGKTVKQVEQLLKRYKKEDEFYNVDGWKAFLKNNNVPFLEKCLSADFSLEF